MVQRGRQKKKERAWLGADYIIDTENLPLSEVGVPQRRGKKGKGYQITPHYPNRKWTPGTHAKKRGIHVRTRGKVPCADGGKIQNKLPNTR